MRAALRALLAVFVLGTLAVPYAQPVWCDARASDMGHDAHDAMAAHGMAMVTVGTVDDGAPPCVPLCVAAHVAPVSVAAAIPVLDRAAVAEPILLPRAVSATPQSLTPPPRA